MLKNFISPINHPESRLSGSTVESMIDRAKALGCDYFSITDNGNLLSVLKGYKYAQSKDIKVIAGVEIYFKDKSCPFIADTHSEHIKYFKLAIHAKTQAAYQEIVKMLSKPTKDSVWIGDVKQNLYTWKDLEQLSKLDVSVSTTDIEDMISKHLLVQNPQGSVLYYKELQRLFGKENVYLCVLPYVQDKYWNSTLEIETTTGHKFKLSDNDRIEYEEESGKKWKSLYKSVARDLLKFESKKKRLTAVYINGVKQKIKPFHQNILNITQQNEFVSFENLDLQLEANKLLIKLAAENNALDQLLLSSYSYYSTKEDRIVQDMKLGQEKRLYQTQHIMSNDDVYEYFKKTLPMPAQMVNRLISNTHAWANNFKDFSLQYDYRLPAVEGGDPLTLLIKRIKEVGRMKWDNSTYTQQLKEEIELLTQNGVINLIPYFLPIVDLYKFYDESGHLTGPGRGSAAGFLVSYLIGITHVDPIEYGLSTSRFLTIDRVQQGNLPDIDCDLDSRKPLVGADGNGGYLFGKYKNKAAQVSTRTLLRIKSAILDANRFVNKGEVEDSIAKLAKSLPNTPQEVTDSDFIFGYEKDGEHIPGLLENNADLKAYAESRPEEWAIVKKALRLARQNSRHACSFIISDIPIEEVVPIMEVGGVKRVTQPEAKQCEQAGLIKYDFLVVTSLMDINQCLKYINKKENTKLSTGWFMHNDVKTYIWDLPKDPTVFKDLSEGKTESVFQLNSVGATRVVEKVKPQSIIDLATITALERPGPKDFRDPNTGRNMVEEYIERRYGRSKGDIPILDQMLPETYGVLCYQEQLVKVAKELAGMSVVDSENVRIAMGKKRKRLIESLKPKFIEGASKKVDEATAEKIWSMMETFARYGFNLSHAVAYSFTSYACAFLKHHYPLEWWSAVLSNASNKEINEEFYKYIKDFILPPDINISTEEITIDYNQKKIRNKLSVITGLGEKAAEKIIAKRPYRNIKDLIMKEVCGDSLLKKLIHVGVLDSLFTDPNMSVSKKIYEYEVAKAQVAFEKKIRKYDLDIEEAKKQNDIISVNRITKLREKFIDKGPKKDIEPDVFYSTLTPKKDLIVKKSIFPTMSIDLLEVLSKDSRLPVLHSKNGSLLETFGGGTLMVLKAHHMQRVDESLLSDNFKFAVPGYVMNMEEFSYHNNTKKALKLVIDSSGYISEKVMWPNYDTGVLKYPQNLSKGCLAWFVYEKRANKIYTNIVDIYVEEEAIE